MSTGNQNVNVTLVPSVPLLPPATNEQFGEIILSWLSGTPDQKRKKLKNAMGACKDLSGLTFGKAVIRQLYIKREFEGAGGNARRQCALCHVDCRDRGWPDFADYFPREKAPSQSLTINIFASNKMESGYVKRPAVNEVPQKGGIVA